MASRLAGDLTRVILSLFLLLMLAGNTDLATAQSNSQQQQQQNRPAQIDKDGLLLLVRSTLYALDLANKSGNYTVLREIGSPRFAAANDANRLSQTFKRLREKEADLSGVLVYEPQLTIMPNITKEEMLHFEGFFPSAAAQIKFEMLFEAVQGRWRIFGLGVDVTPPGPSAVGITTPPTASPPINPVEPTKSSAKTPSNRPPGSASPKPP